MPAASRIALQRDKYKWIPPAALTLLGACVFAGAAVPPVLLQDSPSSIRTILISVRNKDGSPAGISASDLKIKLDGNETSVKSAKSASGIPLYYWLLVDSSGSERSFLKQERDEAAVLLSKVVQSGRDYGTLVSFDQDAYLDAEGTDPQALLKAMAKDIARGSTALFDALFSSADRPTDVREDVRVMFLFGDGQDNNSHVSRDEAMQALLREKIRVYAFGHEGGESEGAPSHGKGSENLKQFAETTGGNVYFPRKSSDFEKAAAEIAGELRSIVSVTFTPSALKSASPIHKLEIECKKRGVSVEAPRLYYVPN
jgi:Ca-activated chloride channel family protein